METDDSHKPTNFDPDADDFFDDPIIKPPPGPLEGRPGFEGLLGVAIIYFVVVILSGLFWSYPPARNLAVSYQTAVNQGRWWQMVTALFVHSDFFHLLSNSPMFLVFGFLLRGYFGPLVFPFSCVLLGAVANYLTVRFMPPHQYLVGMSGMVYAMVAMWLTFFIRFETNYPLGIRIMRALAFSLVLMFPTTYNPSTSYLAHGWGFLLGIVWAFILSFAVKPRSYHH